MDREQLADDLHLIRKVLDQTHRRVDPQMFHMILWGVIVLVWYPLMTWFELRHQHRAMLILSIAAIATGAILSGVLGARAARRPRLAAGNAHLARQVGQLVAIFIATGVVLSVAVPTLVRGGERFIVHAWGLIYALMLMTIGVIYSRETFWCGVPCLVAVVVALRFPAYAGYIVGPAMGLGAIVAGLVAERRVARLRAEAGVEAETAGSGAEADAAR